MCGRAGRTARAGCASGARAAGRAGRDVIEVQAGREDAADGFFEQVAALHQVLAALGGDSARLARRPDGDRGHSRDGPAQSAVRPLAKHYGADVAVCPAHRPQRKGVVEAAIRFIGGRFWRTLRATSIGEAQQALEHFAAGTSDERRRHGSTVGELGSAEPLRALPASAFPAEIAVERVASRSALGAFEGNRYSVPPGHSGRRVVVRARVSELLLTVFSPAGTLVATYRRAPAGARADDPDRRARPAARAGRPGRVHDPDRVSAQGQPARGRDRVGRARPPALPRRRARTGDLATNTAP